MKKKNGIIYLVSVFPSWVMTIQLSKKRIFGNFVLTTARNLSPLKQFTYMYLKGLVTLLSENGIVSYAIGDIRVWIRRILLNFCWVRIFFGVLITNISWMGY